MKPRLEQLLELGCSSRTVGTKRDASIVDDADRRGLLDMEAFGELRMSIDVDAVNPEGGVVAPTLKDLGEIGVELASLAISRREKEQQPRLNAGSQSIPPPSGPESRRGGDRKAPNRPALVKTR